MDSPFFTNRHRYQQPDPYRRPFHNSPSSRGVPIYHVNPTPEPRRPVERASSSSKVVRVPVQFVESQKVDRSGSAVKIQKVFRGFLVRKNLKKIKEIKVQVDEIDESLNRSEVVDLIRKDAKERLRVNETLMALLLKLDSIGGVDFGVRVCRKAVIRKAIALQERIDSIVAADFDRKENDEIAEMESEASYPEGSSCCAEEERDAEAENCDDEDEIIDVGVDCEVKVNEVAENHDEKKIEEGKGASDGKTDRELLEKMMGENEKMMRMMSQLFERNEMQMAKMDALTRRVEMLEKAFLSDRLRKKKKVQGSRCYM